MISVIIPVFNEEANIHSLYERLSGVMQQMDIPYELLFVNDGSKDASLEILRELSLRDTHCRYLSFSRNFGHQVALSAGIDHCRGEYAVFIDADLQDPPEIIPQMYAKLKEGFDVVYAKRESREGESWFKTASAHLFYRLLNKMTRIEIPLDTGDFRLVNLAVLRYLRSMPEKHKFLRGQIAWLGFRQSSFLYQREARKNGESGYSISKMIRLALDGITSFSNWPLRLASLSGFIFSLVGFGLILYTLYSRYIIKDYVPGWASQMITIVFIGGIQLIGIGIIGEYISRMNDNLRNRPLYIVQESSEDSGLSSTLS